MDKKTIGIVTFHTADNYGAVLQAYALQEYIKLHIGHYVEIINFNTSTHEKEHKLFEDAPDLFRKVIYGLFTIPHIYALRTRAIRFAEFRKSFLDISTRRYFREIDFLEDIKHYDYYITGSDQVFNPRVKYRKCYYLGFDKKGSKKIAYAPSFGISKFTDDESAFIKSMIKDFDKLSCRETVGANYLSKLTGQSVPTVCDPVFLLSKEEWEKVIVYPPKQEPYIFVYDLLGGRSDIELARKVSESLGGLKIICATTRTRIRYKGIKVLRNLGPCELLGYIANSECVVTDSFHGTSLSYVMGKKVISYIASKKSSSRILSLTESIGTQNQVVTKINEFSYNTIQFIDYKPKLDKFTSDSKNFLQKSLLD